MHCTFSYFTQNKFKLLLLLKVIDRALEIKLFKRFIILLRRVGLLIQWESNELNVEQFFVLSDELINWYIGLCALILQESVKNLMFGEDQLSKLSVSVY